MNKEERIEEVRQYLGNCCWEPPKYKCGECGREWDGDVELQENFAGIRRASHSPSLWEKIGLCEKCWNEKKSEIVKEEAKKYVSENNFFGLNNLFEFLGFITIAGFVYWKVDKITGLICFVLICITSIPFYMLLYHLDNDEEYQRFREEILAEELLLVEKEKIMRKKGE